MSAKKIYLYYRTYFCRVKQVRIFLLPRLCGLLFGPAGEFIVHPCAHTGSTCYRVRPYPGYCYCCEGQRTSTTNSSPRTGSILCYRDTHRTRGSAKYLRTRSERARAPGPNLFGRGNDGPSQLTGHGRLRVLWFCGTIGGRFQSGNGMLWLCDFFCILLSLNLLCPCFLLGYILQYIHTRVWRSRDGILIHSNQVLATRRSTGRRRGSRMERS